MEITVSDIAKDRLTELVGEHLQDGKAIRVFLGGGGCGCDSAAAGSSARQSPAASLAVAASAPPR